MGGVGFVVFVVFVAGCVFRLVFSFCAFACFLCCLCWLCWFLLGRLGFCWFGFASVVFAVVASFVVVAVWFCGLPLALLGSLGCSGVFVAAAFGGEVVFFFCM